MPLQLETYHTHPQGPSKGILVLLHGVCFGAWYWHNNWQPWFTHAGYEVISMSYRNHGNSEKRGALRWRRIKEYVADVHQVIQACTGPVYLVGHSMGGFVAQHYLQQYGDQQVKKAVLLCTVPHTGILSATLQIARHSPFAFAKALATLSFLPVFRNNRRLRQLLFSTAASETLIEDTLQHLQDESFLAYLDMLLLNLPGRPRHNVPLLYVAAQDDFLISVAALQKAAARSNARLLVTPGTHNLHMENGWEPITRAICDFFDAAGR